MTVASVESDIDTKTGRFRCARFIRPVLAFCITLAAATFASAAPHAHSEAASDATSLMRVLSLQDYTTRTVLLGTLLLGASSGIVGTFMLLRRQALVGDVVSHAALPGVALAFLIGEMLAPGSGRSRGWLLIGAAVTGLLAVVCVNFVRRFSPVKPDAALATVLGVFFGIGAVLFKTVQQLSTGNQAGLDSYILGSASTMIASDVELIAWAAGGVLVFCMLMFKEFSFLCFDEESAAAQGWPVLFLDLILTGLVVAMTVIGLQSVGILMVALLITPPTAARFWTEHLGRMTIIAGIIGGASAVIGSLSSALVPHLAGGPTIVLSGTCFFLVSLLFGTRRGIIRRKLRQRRTRRRIGRDDLVRATYELLEINPSESLEAADASESGRISPRAVQFGELLAHRSWSRSRLSSLIDQCEREGLIRIDSEAGWRLTTSGLLSARRAVRNHRLWEMYLISQADIAPSHVDRDADSIEHVLEPELIEELERLVAERDLASAIPPSPHPVAADR